MWSRVGGRICEGRKEKRLGGERLLHLQKSLLLLGRCHIGCAGKAMLGMKKETLAGGCQRGKGSSETQWTRDQHLCWSDGASPIFATILPSALTARGKRHLELVLCLAKRVKLITVKIIQVKLVCKYTTKNLRTLCFFSFLHVFLGLTQHKYSLLPETIPPDQVLRKHLHISLLPQVAAFPESLNMVENQV